MGTIILLQTKVLPLFLRPPIDCSDLGSFMRKVEDRFGERRVGTLTDRIYASAILIDRSGIPVCFGKFPECRDGERRVPHQFVLAGVDKH